MSITTDIRGYADTAIEQGKQVLDQAQTQFNEVAGQLSGSANELIAKLTGGAREGLNGLTGKLAGNATDAVQDLREQAEKALNVEALKAAVEPYLAQAKGYGATLTERAEELFATVRSDERVAKLVAGAELVNRTVQGRVVQPVRSLTGLGGKPAAKPAVRKPAATKPAATKPAAKPAPTKPAAKPAPTKAGATKAAAKPAAKRTTTKAATSTGAKTTRPRKATPKTENS